MMACRSQVKSTLNLAINAAIRIARSHVTILSANVGERQWRAINHKNLAVKVKLAFLMAPLGSVTQSTPSPSLDKCRVIHLMVVSLNDGSRKNCPSFTIFHQYSNSAVRGYLLASTSSPYRYRRMASTEISTCMLCTRTCSSGPYFAGASHLSICDWGVAT